ncbi:hypothetical protein MUK42_11251 [Musa troglodytarum]|uniref:Bifunctional inhibitor/plant lipid transfer protein/seed storage helical domain-containing protein n=1 Tax=Musa troglodytarum TaxID=320322 RepID=A0A9E7KK66_9LILI|nr:hypothetical protein MUK42_11251 [Musa troglodytarum]
MAARKLVALGAIILWWCAPAALCGDDGIVDGDVTTILPCLEHLLACQENVRHPIASSACCSPMAYLVKHNSLCLCSLFFNDQLLENFNVTRQQMFDLTIRCGIRVAANYCGEYKDGDPSPLSLSSSLPRLPLPHVLADPPCTVQIQHRRKQTTISIR